MLSGGVAPATLSRGIGRRGPRAALLDLGLASAQLTDTVLQDIPAGISGQGSATQSTVRQIGSALGTAFAGATLSIALAATLPAALDDAGLTGPAADSLAAATRDAAGPTIPQLRRQGERGPLGEHTGAAVDALTAGFADATRWALLIAAVFLVSDSAAHCGCAGRRGTTEHTKKPPEPVRIPGASCGVSDGD